MSERYQGSWELFLQASRSFQNRSGSKETNKSYACRIYDVQSEEGNQEEHPYQASLFIFVKGPYSTAFFDPEDYRSKVRKTCFCILEAVLAVLDHALVGISVVC